MSRDPGTHAPEEGIEATNENHSTKKTSRKKKSHLKTCIERVHRALEKRSRVTSPEAAINGISALCSRRDITWSSRQKDQVTGKGKKISVIFLSDNQGKRIEAGTSIQPDWPQGLTEGPKTSSVTPSPQGMLLVSGAHAEESAAAVVSNHSPTGIDGKYSGLWGPRGKLSLLCGFLCDHLKYKNHSYWGSHKNRHWAWCRPWVGSLVSVLESWPQTTKKTGVGVGTHSRLVIQIRIKI